MLIYREFYGWLQVAFFSFVLRSINFIVFLTETCDSFYANNLLINRTANIGSLSFSVRFYWVCLLTWLFSYELTRVRGRDSISIQIYIIFSITIILLPATWSLLWSIIFQISFFSALLSLPFGNESKNSKNGITFQWGVRGLKEKWKKQKNRHGAHFSSSLENPTQTKSNGTESRYNRDN